ncbi:hypothetical protein BDW74DRAFT_86408 [Aspergillus multicolor]|uniref:uncharacterized protein n=1 Tax=Aspergillus multicolor TaxID=41759 RepID=UPI003CCD1309
MMSQARQEPWWKCAPGTLGLPLSLEAPALRIMDSSNTTIEMLLRGALLYSGALSVA